MRNPRSQVRSIGPCLWCSQLLDCLTGLDRPHTPRMEADYHHILKFKGERAVWYRPMNSRYTIGQLKYKMDMIRGKTIYTNNHWKDLLRWMKNNHHYFSFRTASRMSSFSRRERLFVAIASIVLCMTMALFNERNSSKNGPHLPLLPQLMNAFVLWVFNSVLFMLGTCNCAQKEALSSIRKCCEKTAQCGIVSLTMVLCTMLLLMGVITSSVTLRIVPSAILSFIVTLFLTAFVLGPLFSVIYFEICRFWEYRENEAYERAIREGNPTLRTFYVPYTFYSEWESANQPRYQGDEYLTRDCIAEADAYWSGRLGWSSMITELATSAQNTRIADVRPIPNRRESTASLLEF